MRAVLIWTVLTLVLAVPLVLAAQSNLIAYREPVYIMAGFAGIGALLVMLLQPLLAAADLPLLSVRQSRNLHRILGLSLVILVLMHVIGLYFTSPPDVIDALLFVSPTPFSVWGVIAMWAVFAAALTVALRRRLRMSPRTTRRIHTGFVIVIVAGSVVHTLLITGTMESVSKVIFCSAVAVVTAKVVFDRWTASSK